MPYKLAKTKDPNNHFDKTDFLLQMEDNITIDELCEGVTRLVRAVFEFHGRIGIIEDEEE